MVRGARRPLTPDAVTAGQRALAKGDWDEARNQFESALAAEERAEALEGLSWAAWWLNNPDTLLRTRERAYRVYMGDDDRLGAARMAIWLASDYADFRGEEAIANGWRQRARRLLDGLDPAPEHGWLALHEGDVALLMRDDTATAKRCARDAADLGRRLKMPDLEVLGLAMEGIALVTEGHAVEGMDKLDEATTAALAGELQEIYSVTWALCYLIYACERLRDYDRAAQWCQKMKEFAEPYQFRFVMGVCRAHYGGVLVWRGSWEQAETELSTAVQDLEMSRPPMAAEAAVRLAELRRRQGRLDEATVVFREFEWHPLAALGLAELALDKSDPAEARDRAEGLLRSIPEDNKTQQIAALDVIVRAAAAFGDLDRAAETLVELQALSGAIDSQPVRATAAHAAGTVAAASGDLGTARQRLEDAAVLFGRLGAPYEMARARLDLAGVLLRLGRVDTAEQEARHALKSFESIGAISDSERARAFIHQLSSSGKEPKAGGRSNLTARELDVLRLVASGLSDKEVASELTLSEHTVHRHVANILTKFDLPSRAAAVAEAARQGLL